MAYPISDVPRRIVYSGSAGVGPYAFTFEVLANTDIAVYKNTTLLTLTTDYTVSINTGTGTGTVTLVVAATGADTVTIVGDRAIRRTSDFVTGGDLFANTLNEELDAQTIYTQQVDEKADRAIKIPVTDPTNLSMTLPSQASRAQKLLGFNASGEPTAYVATTTVSDTSLINFTQAGTGAVTRTAQAKMRDVVSVKDFGAVGDGVTDDTAAIQAAFNYAFVQNEQGITSGVIFPAGIYIVSGTISIANENVYVAGLGIAQVKPSVLTGASTYAIFNLPNSASRLTIKDLTFYMFGSDCTAISAANIWRQSTIYNCQFIGGNTGLDFAAGPTTDKWGVTVEKCRFQDQKYGVRWIMNGQTGTVKDCLFFNCTITDLTVTQGLVGSQLTIIGTVFENGASALATALNIQGIKEVTMIGVQGERLGYKNADTGAASDYQFYFLNSTVAMIGCRLWGGSFGSVAPGNSRGFGVYLDGTRLKLVNSRIYSFRKVAMKFANGSVCSTDLDSQLDFRCLAGTPKFECDADLGDNQITNGDYIFWNAGGGKPYPLGWYRAGSAGTINRTTTGLLEPASQAAVDLTASTEPHYTNYFNVAPGEWVTFRCAIKAPSAGGYIIAQDQSGSSFFASYDPTSPYNRIVASASDDPLDSTRDNSALVVWSFQIPAGTSAMRFQFNGGMWLESMAAYRGVKTNITNAGALYSDNDASYGCWINLGPPIPFKPSSQALTDTLTPANIGGTFQQGTRLVYTTPAAGGFEGLIVTTSGTGGGTAVMKTYGAISP